MKTIIATLATVMTFSIAGQASVLKSGNYQMNSYNETWSESPRADIKISNNNHGQIIIRDKDVLKGSTPLIISPNKLESRQGLNGLLVEKAKAAYKDNAFVDKVEGIDVVVTENSNKKLALELSFNLNFISTFGEVKKLRLTSDVSFTNSTCKYESTSRLVECIKLESFKNIRVTDMQTSFERLGYDKLIGFISDIVIQTVLSPVRKIQYLIPVKQ